MLLPDRPPVPDQRESRESAPGKVAYRSQVHLGGVACFFRFAVELDVDDLETGGAGQEERVETADMIGQVAVVEDRPLGLEPELLAADDELVAPPAHIVAVEKNGRGGRLAQAAQYVGQILSRPLLVGGPGEVRARNSVAEVEVEDVLVLADRHPEPPALDDEHLGDQLALRVAELAADLVALVAVGADVCCEVELPRLLVSVFVPVPSAARLLLAHREHQPGAACPRQAAGWRRTVADSPNRHGPAGSGAAFPCRLTAGHRPCPVPGGSFMSCGAIAGVRRGAGRRFRNAGW